MSSRRIKRIFNEIKELEDSKKILIDSGIYFGYDEDNLDKIHVMFVGPKDTPYEKGFYFFELTYPENYPMTPPNMKYFTQGYLYNKKKQNIKIRFNPNLYTNGKVCLSMLNTWKGPGWVPTNTVSNVLVAVQALVFNEDPLRNEPGFESSGQSQIDMYSKVIKFSNIKVAIIDQVSSNLGLFENFRDTIKEYYKNNLEYYDNMVEELCKSENEEVKTPAYGMDVYLDYENLGKYYETFKTKILLGQSTYNNIENETSTNTNTNTNIIEKQKEVEAKV